MAPKDEACSCRAHCESRVNFSWAADTAPKINTGTKITNLSLIYCMSKLFSLLHSTQRENFLAVWYLMQLLVLSEGT